MKNIAVINAIGLAAPALRPLGGGAGAFERALRFARGLPGVQETVVLTSMPLPGATGSAVRTVQRPAWSVVDLLGALSSASQGCDDVFYFFGDCGLLDAGLASRMHANHRRYFADYTFADGYPFGLAPEILRAETAPRLVQLAGSGADAKRPPDRETLFTVIRKDINSFDVETELSPVDLRMMRAMLCAASERDFLLLQRVVERGGTDAESACRILQEDPRILRTLPAWFPVQVVERCPQSCAYCPYPVFGGDPRARTGVMPVESFDALVGKIEAFAGTAVVGISLWGDPALHPDPVGLARVALARPGIDLVVETSGVGWKPGVLQAIRAASGRDVTWIVSLDGASRQTYSSLRGDGYDEALATVEALMGLYPGSTWVQAVRMKENEEDLEAFYRTWKARTGNVIIQKHDWFCGDLPDRRVADLSPVTRFPCWHLGRDMPVLLDGTVPVCREETAGARVLGNAFAEELATIWDRGAGLYGSHVARDYPGRCAGCDEYYTFNF